MLGFKPLVEKLRDGDGKVAEALVLEAKRGRERRSETGLELTKFTYTLRVQPDGEAPFEATIKTDPRHTVWYPGKGDTAEVIYDPAKPKRIAFNLTAGDMRDLGLAD